MNRRRNVQAAAVMAAALALAACSGEPEDSGTNEHEGLLDDIAAEQAAAHDEQEASIDIIGGLVLTPQNSLVLDDDWCLPAIADQATHDRVFALTDEPQVQIRDAADRVVGTARIETGISSAGDACTFTFETTVPSGGGYYAATVESFTTDLVAEDEAVGGVIVLDLLPGL